MLLLGGKEKALCNCASIQASKGCCWEETGKEKALMRVNVK